MVCTWFALEIAWHSCARQMQVKGVDERGHTMHLHWEHNVTGDSLSKAELVALKECTTLAVATSQLVLETSNLRTPLQMESELRCSPKMQAGCSPSVCSCVASQASKHHKSCDVCLSGTATLQPGEQLVECIWPIYVEHFEEQHRLPIWLQ